MTVESIAELKNSLIEIEKWEKQQKSLMFWEKIGRIPFMLLDKLTPRFIQDKISLIINEVGNYVQTGGRYLLSERQIVKRLEKVWKGSGDSTADNYNRLSLEEVAAVVPLTVMRQAADQLAGSRSNMATIQGATTGIGGFFTLAADIPAILGLSLKMIQEIAVCYGYDPALKEERIFAVKCLQFASSDVVGKKAILDELADYGNPAKQAAVISQLQGWREVVVVYRDNFGWKKLFQLVPVAGMVFGAFINRGMLKEVAESTQILYRKRRVLERLRAHSETEA